MKIRVRLAVLLALLLVVFSLTACGGKTDNKTGDGLEGENGAKLSIMIPGHNPNSEEPAAWQNSVVKAFKEAYPDITVEWVVAGWDAWETKLLANISAGDPVDVINDGANNNPKFALKGISQPLNDFVNLKNSNLHIDTMDAVFNYNDDYYVAVSETNVCVIYYNKYLFESAGLDDPMELYEQGKWNWDTFKVAAKQLTDKKDQKWGFATNYPYIFFGSNQTSMLTLDSDFKYQLNINSSAMKNSLELIQDGYYTSGWSGYDGDPWSTFFKGAAAMLGDFQWVEAQILDAKEYGLANFDYGVVPMPSGPDNKDGVSPITAAGWAIGAGSDCPNHAGKLIDMLIDGQAAYTEQLNKRLEPAHVDLYKQLAQKPYCTNSYDSAVGGAFEICTAIQQGQSITQAIEEFKPVYQRMVDEANQRISNEK